MPLIATFCHIDYTARDRLTLQGTDAPLGRFGKLGTSVVARALDLNGNASMQQDDLN